MLREEIPLNLFKFDSLIFRDSWLLLTSGSLSHKSDPSSHEFPRSFNSMTISWGSAGQIWDRVFFQVVVRPQRYTYQFMERYDSFSLCAFPLKYRPALSILGSKSGRDLDKIAKSGLTPIPGAVIEAPGYDEAELIVECRKIYSHDIDPERFLDPEIDKNYERRDYHRAYFGEVLHVAGTDAYRRLAGGNEHA